MKKIIWSLLLWILLSISNSSFADINPQFCEQTKNDYFCAINGQTLVPCQAFSDTSTRQMIPAYSGTCTEYPPLSIKARQTIINILYQRLEPHITYQAIVQTYYNGTFIPVFHDIKTPKDAPWWTSKIITKLDEKWKSMVSQNIFPAIAKAIKQEIRKTNPNMMKVSILHHIAYTFQYDFNMINNPAELNPLQ